MVRRRPTRLAFKPPKAPSPFSGTPPTCADDAVARNRHNIHNSVSLLSGLLGTTVTPLSSRRGADDTLARLASSAHIYPLPLHAGAIEREPVLGQLLRKKQEPDVEAWVQRAAAFVKKDGSTDQRTGDDGKGVPPSVAQLEELWQGAVGRAGELAQELPWGSAFTKRERDGQDGVAGVRTGLRRDLAAMEASEQDGEGEDEEEEDGVDDEDVIMD